MAFVLGIVTTLCLGLMIGVEFAVSAFINPALARLDTPARLHATRLFAAKLGFVMPFWYVLSLLLLLAEMLLAHQPQLLLLGAAAGIWVLVIILTLLFLVPINNRLVRLSPDADPHVALSDHQRWDSMHRVRVAALITAMILFLLAVRL